MFKFTAGIFPILFVLYVGRYIYLQIIYLNTNWWKSRPQPVITTGTKAIDFWPSRLTVELLSKGRFIRSIFDAINIENFCVRDRICWCSDDPVFASNYFVTSSKNFNNSCFENFKPTSQQLDPAVGAIL